MITLFEWAFWQQVAGFVSLLQRFFTYGLSSGSSLTGRQTEQFSLQGGSSRQEISGKSNSGGRYRPPHLRKLDNNDRQQRSYDNQSLSSKVSSELSVASSDSEHSDTDGSVKDIDKYQSSKVRLAALMCVQVRFLASIYVALILFFSFPLLFNFHFYFFPWFKWNLSFFSFISFGNRFF